MTCTLAEAVEILNRRRHRGSSDWVILDAIGVPTQVYRGVVGEVFTPFEATAIAMAYEPDGHAVETIQAGS